MYQKIVRERQHVERLNNYPFVMIHGLGGWGEDTLAYRLAPYWGIRKERDILPVARELGFEVYAPSVGPVNSIWDRACELWAQLVGGTVDYGKVHSEKFGHERYGNTYDTPLIPDWGQLDEEGKRKKINVVGHSFGGPTTRAFIEILAEGSKEEQEGTPAEELSEFFKGGKASWVHTCTELACCNGVTLATMVDNNKKVLNAFVYTIAIALGLIGETPIVKFVDFKMPQWHITPPEYKGGLKGAKIWIGREKLKALATYPKNIEDNIAWELGVKTCYRMTKDYSPKSNIYYFSYAADTTEEVPGTEFRQSIPGTNPFMGLFGNMEGKYLYPEDGIDDPSWYASDGMVNLRSARHPEGEPFKVYDGEESIEPGIWMEMPIEQKHHMSYMGLGETTGTYHIFFFDFMKRACNLPAIEE